LVAVTIMDEFLNILSIILLPPGLNFALMIVALIVYKKRKSLSRKLLIINAGFLLLLAMPFVARSLMSSLEPKPLVMSELKELMQSESKKAIVVLSYGRQILAKEYGDIDTINDETLLGLQYAVWLKKKTEFPLLVSSGNGKNKATSDTILINNALIANFEISPDWLEAKSVNLQQSAEFSKAILKQEEINQLVIIAPASQAKKVAVVFENHGFEVMSAAYNFHFSDSQLMESYSFLPSSYALYKSAEAIEEIIIYWWYDL